MLHLEMNIADIDYMALINKVSEKSNNPQINMLKMAIKNLSKEQRDKMVADLINNNKPTIKKLIEETAKEQGIKMTVKGLGAK